MIIKSSKFLRAVTLASQAPSPTRPAAIFAGRSNSGKSSLINALTGNKGLAKTSSTPGRTREIVYFEINEKWRFIDLPGYGYAAVPQSVRRQWGPMIERFIGEVQGVRLAVVILDARRKPSPDDLQLVDWLRSIEMPRVFAVTKIDKLRQSEVKPQLAAIREALGSEDAAAFVPFSAETGVGRKELLRAIGEALAGDPAPKEKARP